MLNMVPFAFVFSIYILSAAVISRITMDSIDSRPPIPGGRLLEFLGRSFIPVFIANIALFLAIELVLILFGRIPVVGPVLFALMFLPIYAASICVILIVAVGFWFYPPIIAASSGGMTALPGMFTFIRRQNFSLAYTVPLMAIITAVTFAAIYLLHYGSFSLSMFLAKNVLAEEGEKIFSAVPPSFLSISDLTIMGSDAGSVQITHEQPVPLPHHRRFHHRTCLFPDLYTSFCLIHLHIRDPLLPSVSHDGQRKGHGRSEQAQGSPPARAHPGRHIPGKKDILVAARRLRAVGASYFS